MKKKALFLVNPHSGKGLIKNNLLGIIDVLVNADYEVTVYPTQGRGDAERLTRERDSIYDLVVCSGGDGTLDEIVTGMIQSGRKTTIGYIPAGSTNDFANSLNLPTSMKKAAEVIAAGKVFACDVGLFDEDVFVYMLGHMAYILEGVKHLQNIKSYQMKVTYKTIENNGFGETEECEKVVEDDFIFGMITNSLSVGGFKSLTGNVMGKNVVLNDGLFEVTLVKMPKNPVELNSILVALMSEKVDTEFMYCLKSSELLIESQEEVAWTLDGEYGGKHTCVKLKNKQKAIDILVPTA